MKNLKIQTTELLEIKLSEEISCGGGYQLWTPSATNLISTAIDTAHNLYDFISGVNTGIENAMKYIK